MTWSGVAQTADCHYDHPQEVSHCICTPQILGVFVINEVWPSAKYVHGLACQGLQQEVNWRFCDSRIHCQPSGASTRLSVTLSRFRAFAALPVSTWVNQPLEAALAHSRADSYLLKLAAHGFDVAEL